MKKKILSIVVAICLVSMALPMQTASVSAAGHIHCICGATDCSGEGHDPSQEWQKWSVDNDLPFKDEEPKQESMPGVVICPHCKGRFVAEISFKAIE